MPFSSASVWIKLDYFKVKLVTRDSLLYTVRHRSPKTINIIILIVHKGFSGVVFVKPCGRSEVENVFVRPLITIKCAMNLQIKCGINLCVFG